MLVLVVVCLINQKSQCMYLLYELAFYSCYNRLCLWVHCLPVYMTDCLNDCWTSARWKHGRFALLPLNVGKHYANICKEECKPS